MKSEWNKGEGVKSSAFAFACATPLQVLDSVDFVLGNCLNCQNNSDIYIYGAFHNAEELYQSVKESGLFNNAYFVRPVKVYPKIINKVPTAWRVLFPEQALKKHTQPEFKTDGEYEYLCFAYPVAVAVWLNLIYRNSKLIGLDEGLVSYMGNVLKDFHSDAFSIFLNVVLRGKILKKFEARYLYNPDMARYNDCPLKKLPPLRDAGTLSRLEEIFHYKKNDLFEKNKGIYLTQPLYERKGFTESRERILLGITKEQLGNRWIVRIHPRQNRDSYADYKTDCQNNMWELECIRQIGDENVLIGAYSTAQFYPKMLVDKEPYIIFTYKLLIDDDRHYPYSEIEEMISKLKRMYRKPEKIFVPNTTEEFEQELNRFAQKGK